MSSLKKNEGYLMIDNRMSEGISREAALAAGLPVEAATGLYESATYTCNHCNGVVVMNPNRTRERAYCRGCDHRLCDACGVIRAATMQCRPIQKIIDEVLTEAEKQASKASLILLHS